ncbi:MAG: hypothetical protein J6D34_04495 [Atopobiaceae bacterium]|nr:hypothetical protein [Atopobiaceae bacterium]
MGSLECWSYVSTRACADPVRTVILCAPDEYAGSARGVATFARESGWMDEVEADGGVIVAPVVPQGWAHAPADLAREAYRQACRQLVAPARMSIPGRAGGLWAWEPLISLVGYQEGAVHVGGVMVAHPAFAASYVLVDGSPSDLSCGDEPSDHWFVAHPSNACHALNREVPVAAWLMGSACDEALVAHLRAAGGPSWSLRMSPELAGVDPTLAAQAMREFVCHVIRWKNGPDGELAWHQSRQEFYLGDRFDHRVVELGYTSYHYALHLPDGMTRDEAQGLPLVISIHGRGEPSHLFADKNGWEALADETRAFMVAVPDSPYNVWLADRDSEVLERLIDDVADAYGCDRTRVYATGFSNGGAYTCQQATTRPWLFAAVSPWNAPSKEAITGSGMGDYFYHPSFAAGDYELPFWICTGDSDDKGVTDRTADLADVLPPNGATAESERVWDESNRYTSERGYREGMRISSRVFCNAQGSPRVGLTVARDMPHGAIADEARAAWEFMSRFCRPVGSKKVEEV